MRPLRFCHLTTFYPPHNFGGDGIAVQRLCHSLARRGHHVTVMYDVDAYNALRTGPEPEVTAEPEGVRVVRLHSRLGIFSPLLTQQLGRPVVHGRRIARFFDSESFDVINFHNVSLVGGPGLLRAGASVKLYTAHEHWLVCPTHVLWRHDRQACPGRQCLRCVLAHRRPLQWWRYSGLLDREARHIDAFIALSEFSRSKHREFGFPFDMDVLPDFLPDPGSVSEDLSPRRHSRPYFLFVGRLEKPKGLDDVIPVFRDYQGADLLVAGDGAEAPALRRLAADIPHVRFLGRLLTDQLPHYYRHAIAVIVPTRGFDTFGLILIEAFQARTPVIARHIGPYPSILALSQGGELYSSRDELVRAMRRLQEESPRREMLAENAYRAYREHWSESAVVPQALDIVRRAAERRGARSVLEALDA